MPTVGPSTLDFRDFFFVAPEMLLAVWGLVVLLLDLWLARRLDPAARRLWVGRVALAGTGLAFAVALAVGLVPLMARAYPEDAGSWLSKSMLDYLFDTDPSLFSGTLAGDLQVGAFDLLYIVLLGLIVGLSRAWSFTEEWGEFLALLFWATVGMMLLSAAEELITLFVALETMTICLYLATALEKTRRRSAEAGLKYFIYGSVSSALFLFGLSYVYGLTGTTHLSAIRRLLVEAQQSGLTANAAGATAVLLILAGFGFKIAAVPFHQWAPDAYEGAPAPAAAWIATGSKIASLIAFMKVFANALGPWASPESNVLRPGWIGIVAVVAAVTMTYGNLAALRQRNFKRMLAYSSIAHGGYLLVGVIAVGLAADVSRAAGAVLFYLVVYSFANLGAFAAAAWLARDKESDQIDDLNGLGRKQPLLAICITLLMLSLIGIPPLGGFFGKLYVFMEALDERTASRGSISLVWLVGLALLNSVVSAFYYVRVLRAMFLREPAGKPMAAADRLIALPILLSTAVVVGAGLRPDLLIGVMQAAAAPMLTTPIVVHKLTAPTPVGPPAPKKPTPAFQYSADQMKKMGQMATGGAGPPGGGGPAPKAKAGTKSATPKSKAQAPASKKAENRP